eukprot:3935730-Rhodomonas_salina.1
MPGTDVGCAATRELLMICDMLLRAVSYRATVWTYRMFGTGLGDAAMRCFVLSYVCWYGAPERKIVDLRERFEEAVKSRYTRQKTIQK